MKINSKEEMLETNKDLACFPAWFLTMTESKLLLVIFGILVLVCAPVLMVFGAFYPLFKH